MLERLIAKLTLNAAIVALLVGSLVVQTVRIEGLRIWPVSITGLKDKLSNTRAELQRISDAKDRQRKETERRIAEAEKNVRVVERVVTKLENRPLPGNCATPDLESWREVL